MNGITSNKDNYDNSFYRNIALLLAVNLVIKPIYILCIDAEVQNVLGESEYGLFFSLFNFCMLFQIVLDPGILNYNSQLVSKRPKDVSALFSKTLGSKLLLVIAFITVLFIGGLVIGFPDTYFSTMLGVAAILALNSFLIYFRSHFSALGFYKYEGLLSGLDKMLMILIIGYFLYVQKDISISKFVLGQIVALSASCILFLFLLNRMFAIRVSFSLRETTALIKQTGPYALVLLLMTIYTRIDGIMLERLLDDKAYSAGVYAAGFRLLDAANMIGIIFAMLMLPMFSKLMNDMAKLNVLVKDVTKLLFIICTLISMLSWFYAHPIIDTIYDNPTNEHYIVFKYLMIGFWAMCLSNIYGCLFLAKGTLSKINLLFAFGILINLVLNIYWIPKDQAFGAVKATLITQFFVFLGQAYLANRSFKFSFPTSEILLYLGILGGFTLLFYVFQEYIHLEWLIEMLLISFLAIVLSFLCGFLRFPFELRKT